MRESSADFVGRLRRSAKVRRAILGYVLLVISCAVVPFVVGALSRLAWISLLAGWRLMP